MRSSNKVKGANPSHGLAGFTGKYAHPGYGTFTVTYERDSLIAQFKRMKLWLAHHHYDVFNAYTIEQGVADTTSGENPIQFQFFGNEVGEISRVSIKLEPTLSPLEFTRSPIRVDVGKETLKAYAGEFELGGMVVKFFVTNETLRLTVPGQPEYELVPTGSNKFVIKGLEGFKIEFVETSGTFSEAVFSQPNGVFRAKRK